MCQDRHLAAAPADPPPQVARDAPRGWARMSSVLHGLAAVYSVLLLTVACTVPMGDPPETWAQRLGSDVLLAFGQPLLVSALLWPLLRHPTSDRLGAAWLVATVYLLWSLLGWYWLTPAGIPTAVLLFIAVHRRTEEVRRTLRSRR
jgi:hypothetical protein